MEEDEYDELKIDVPCDGTLGGAFYGTAEDHLDSTEAREIPFQSIHEKPLPFSDKRRRVFIRNVPITARIIKHERSVTKHLLNPYLYTIALTHGNYTWTIHKRYKHIQLLHNQLKIFRATLMIPFPTKDHKSNRQSLKELKEGGDAEQGKSRGLLPRFPKIPEAMISYDQIEDRALQLEEYLNNLLSIKLYREHPSTYDFLLVSHLSFVNGLGVKGMEDVIRKQTGSSRKGCDFCGLLDNAVCTRCVHISSDICGGWRHRWLLVKDTFIAYVRPRDGAIRGVMLFDQGFEVSAGLYSSGMRNRLQVINSQRRVLFKCGGKRKRLEWSNYIKEISSRQGYGFINRNKNSSFAPPRPDTNASWFVDGSSYMSAVADAINNAREEIFIADWWLSPEIYLKRPALQGNQWRLDHLLQKKACEGVKIFVLLYKEVEFALGINSYYSKCCLSKCHTNNIKVLRHPDHANSGVFLWAHHEKIVCIDQTYAFLGGIDLCYGRWDDYNHRLKDFGDYSTGENMHKKKITSSRPLGNSPRPLVALVQASNNIGVGTMTSFQSGNSEELIEEDEISRNVSELGITQLEEEAEEVTNDICNEDAEVSQEEINVVCQPNAENVKCNTPEAERKPFLRSLKDSSRTFLNRFTSDSLDKKELEAIEPVLEVKKDVPVAENASMAIDDSTVMRHSFLKDLRGSVKYWIGKDYTNFIVKDFKDLDSPYQDLVDRTTTPRMPWHDVGVMVHGAAARDVARHFIQRWNAVKVEKAKRLNNYPYLLPKSYETFEVQQFESSLQKHKVKCQVLRSLSSWSGGFLDPEVWEESIHEAYITSIAQSQHYIYIENQFFISLARQNLHVKNQIGEAICKRIMKAHKEGKKFRVYIVLPLLPGFEGEVGGTSGTALHAITHWNYASICRGNNSIISRLQELGIENPSDYISFHGLRNQSEFHGDYVTELIYVHSKLMIIDDRIVICGSANINDRSMLGKRDSEIAVLIEDEEFVMGQINNETVEVGKFASSLRNYLFGEHLGYLSSGTTLCNYELEENVKITDPVSDEFYNDIWKATSTSNTRIFEEVFRCLPSDRVTNFKDLGAYKDEISLLVSDKNAAKTMLDELKGHLVDLPLNFLMNENLTPARKTVEGMMPVSLWT